MAHSQGLKHYWIGINEKQLSTITDALKAKVQYYKVMGRPVAKDGEHYSDPQSILDLLDMEGGLAESPAQNQLGDIF